MVIIVGLGNPGREYEKTRHNAGFMVIDKLADEAGISVNEKKHKAVVGKGIIAGEKVVLVKPQTYMNLSGESVREVIDFYKVDEKEDLIVISDDIDLDVGQLRIRGKGSAGGHNGLKNIIQHLGHQDFARVRVGVGAKRAGSDLAAHVLGTIDKADLEDFESSISDAAGAIKLIIEQDVATAMNKYNVKKTAK